MSCKRLPFAGGCGWLVCLPNMRASHYHMVQTSARGVLGPGEVVGTARLLRWTLGVEIAEADP